MALACDGRLCSMTLTRDGFEKATADLIEATMDCLERAVRDSGLKMSQVDEILLVGGASRMPVVAKRVEKRFGKVIAKGVEPHYAAAFGNVVACRMARERAGRPLISGNIALPPLNHHYEDVTAHPIGVCVLSEDHKLVNQVILEKGMPMPSEQLKTFKLVDAEQTTALIEILQGPDSLIKEKCALLGHFELSGLPSQKNLMPRIEIKLHIDQSGMLTANARDTVSGKSAELVIDYSNHGPEGREASKDAA